MYSISLHIYTKASIELYTVIFHNVVVDLFKDSDIIYYSIWTTKTSFYFKIKFTQIACMP